MGNVGEGAEGRNSSCALWGGGEGGRPRRKFESRLKPTCWVSDLRLAVLGEVREGVLVWDPKMGS